MANDQPECAPSQMYTVREVAELFYVSERTVYRWVKSKKLKAVQIGRVVRIAPYDLDQFIKSSQK